MDTAVRSRDVGLDGLDASMLDADFACCAFSFVGEFSGDCLFGDCGGVRTTSSVGISSRGGRIAESLEETRFESSAEVSVASVKVETSLDSEVLVERKSSLGLSEASLGLRETSLSRVEAMDTSDCLC